MVAKLDSEIGNIIIFPGTITIHSVSKLTVSRQQLPTVICSCVLCCIVVLNKHVKNDAGIRNSEDRLELRLSVPSSCQLSTFVVQSNPVQTKTDLSFDNYLANAKSKILTKLNCTSTLHDVHCFIITCVLVFEGYHSKWQDWSLPNFVQCYLEHFAQWFTV